MSTNIKIAKLEQKHQNYINTFTCINNNEKMDNLNSKKKRRVKKHSEEIDVFFKNEALEEQAKFLNATHLFFMDSELVGFISLCADSLRLSPNEKEDEKVPYITVPAVKIARLATSSTSQRKGVGKTLIKFAVKTVFELRKTLGIKFITVDCYEHRLSYYMDMGFLLNKIQTENKKFDNPISLRLDIDEYLKKLDI